MGVKMVTMSVGPADEPVDSSGDDGPTRLRRVRRVLVGDGAVVPLAGAHGLSAAGDAFVTVSLAGSLFFSVSPDASRQQVLLYLLITMAPLAVLAPLIGPAVDRFRSSQRFVAALFYVLRGIFCLALVSTLLQLAFYPIVLALLIVSKASGVVKQTLVQTLVDDPELLVATNARLARFASIMAAIAAGSAAAIFSAFGAEWSLRGGAVLLALAGAVILRARPRRTVPVTTDDVEYAETHMPTVVIASIGMMAIRAAVGFFIFTLAFTLRRDSEPTYVYGVAAACYGLGAFTGHTATAMLRRWLREEQLIGLAIALPAAFTVIGALGASVPMLMVISALVGLSTTMGRNAFDGLLQRRAPEALLGRAGARYETWFQLSWVFGGVLATPISLPVEISMMVLTGIYVPALIVFVRGLGEAQRFELTSRGRLSIAQQRLLAARQACEAGAFRAAIVDAFAATDLAQSVVGDWSEGLGRADLDELRRAAIDPGTVIGEPEAVRALQIADRLISSASPI
jgi:hypothetical protein